MEQTVYRDLIMYNVEAEDALDAISKAGKRLEEKGFVKNTYIDAVIAREKEFPTGLQLRNMGIAMPHTAGIHVITPAVCVVRLAHPVTFSFVADPNVKVEAELLFMMAIKDPDRQIDTLKKMANIFSDEDVLARFAAASSEEELYETAKSYIN